MKLSRERLLRESGTTGFRPESLEKVIRLVGLLNGIFRHADLRERLVLKGGTALNLFLFDVPRLSVDIDLNYIGSAERTVMERERPALEAKLQAVFEADDFSVRRMPVDHAGGKWQLRFTGAQGQGGNLEVDLNFLHRIPLEPIQVQDSNLLGSFQAKGIPVLDIHDLAAGKLVALLDRCAARDVFDAAGLFAHPALDLERLRLPFVVMGAMSREMDLRTATPERAMDKLSDFDRMVRPLLRQGVQGPDPGSIQAKVREGLARLLPLRLNEAEFVEAIWERGEIHADLVTADPEAQSRIAAMPLLLWKAQNVRQHRGL